MPRKGFSIEEALSVFQDIPSDIDSDVTEGSSDAETIREEIEEPIIWCWRHFAIHIKWNSKSAWSIFTSSNFFGSSVATESTWIKKNLLEEQVFLILVKELNQEMKLWVWRINLISFSVIFKSGIYGNYNFPDKYVCSIEREAILPFEFTRMFTISGNQFVNGHKTNAYLVSSAPDLHDDGQVLLIYMMNSYPSSCQ